MKPMYVLEASHHWRHTSPLAPRNQDKTTARLRAQPLPKQHAAAARGHGGRQRRGCGTAPMHARPVLHGGCQGRRARRLARCLSFSLSSFKFVVFASFSCCPRSPSRSLWAAMLISTFCRHCTKRFWFLWPGCDYLCVSLANLLFFSFFFFFLLF